MNNEDALLGRLISPPLVEAVCEFRFSSTEEWDWTIPGRLYDQIGTVFSERSQVAVSDFSSNGSLVLQDRVQMKKKDGSAMVQLSPRLLAINHFLPYSDWDVFFKIIIEVLEKYLSLTEGHFEKIGLRYINQIPAQKDGFEINKYITLNPSIPEAIKKPIKTFYQRYELIHEDPEGILIHQTGLATSSRGEINVMLDLDFTSSAVAHIDKDSIKNWLTKAHDHIEDGFKVSVEPSLLAKMKKG